MTYRTKEIKKGIKLHCIETEKFKTNLLAMFITVPLTRQNVTLNSVIPAVLKRGTKELKTQEEISKKLENMYGASFDCGIEKIGDNHVIKFYLEALNDNFIPKEVNQDLLKQSVELLLDIILNPLVEEEAFKAEYVKAEKENIKVLIESKIDNKDAYAYNRCVEEMYKNEPYGLYKYGYIEDLEKIDEKNLYKYYKELIENSKIDIFISGELNIEKTANLVAQNQNIIKLPERETHISNNPREIKNKEIQIIEDKMDITQGKLVMGLDVNEQDPEAKFKIAIYNVILGESATSKLFQNVREKASLAYTARSNYVRQKSNIYIRCGIEIANYEKTVKIIKEQLEDMKNGKFTEEDIKNAKKYMTSGIESIQDEQDSEITYYLGQELSQKLITFKEYAEKIEEITKEDVKEIANKISINTIYFLRN